MLSDKMKRRQKLENYIKRTPELREKDREDSLFALDDLYESGFDSRYIPSYVYAVYDASGILPPGTNRYDQFVDLLSETMNIECNILEVGGGTIPCVAERIAKMQIHGGTIAVYDEKLLFNSSQISNLKLYTKNFNCMTNIKSINMLVGVLPCQAMDLMVNRALKENKELFIQMCNCVHPVINFPGIDYSSYGTFSDEFQEELIDHYIKLAREYGRKIKVLDKRVATCPIIYSKK